MRGFGMCTILVCSPVSCRIRCHSIPTPQFFFDKTRTAWIWSDYSPVRLTLLTRTDVFSSTVSSLRTNPQSLRSSSSAPRVEVPSPSIRTSTQTGRCVCPPGHEGRWFKYLNLLAMRFYCSVSEYLRGGFLTKVWPTPPPCLL